MTEKQCKNCPSTDRSRNSGNLCRACYNAASREQMRVKRGTPPEKFRATASERKFPMGTCYDCGEAVYLNSRCRKHYNEFAKRYKRKRPPRTTCRICGDPREAGSNRVLCEAHRKAIDIARKPGAKKPRAPRLPVASSVVVKAKPAPPVVYFGERQAVVEKPVVIGPEEVERPEPVKPKSGTKVVYVPYRDEEWEQRGKGRMEALESWR